MSSGKIERLFSRRDSTYEKQTQMILDAITPNMISAIIEFVKFNPEELSRLEWHSVRLVDGYIMLSGAIIYKSGEQIIATDGEETITLDATTALILNKLVRFTLPIEIVETYSREEIVAYYKEMETRYKEEYQDIYGSDPTLHEINIDDYPGNSFEEKLGNAVDLTMGNSTLPIIEEFEYSELTDEQKESLQLSKLLSPVNKGSKAN